jgi:hypothetical protein
MDLVTKLSKRTTIIKRINIALVITLLFSIGYLTFDVLKSTQDAGKLTSISYPSVTYIKEKWERQ